MVWLVVTSPVGSVLCMCLRALVFNNKHFLWWNHGLPNLLIYTNVTIILPDYKWFRVKNCAHLIFSQTFALILTQDIQLYAAHHLVYLRKAHSAVVVAGVP